MDKHLNAQPVDPNLLDWIKAATEFIPQAILVALVTIMVIERATEDVYARAVSTKAALAHAVIRVFIPNWRIEEIRHGELIERYLKGQGMDCDPMPRPLKVRLAILKSLIGNRLLCFLFGDRALVTHMTWGAINEASAASIYRGIVQQCPGTELAKLLTRLLTQENAHGQFYTDWAVTLLAEDKAKPRTLVQRAVAALTSGKVTLSAEQIMVWVVSHYWTPVGNGVVSQAHLRLVARAAYGGTARPLNLPKEADAKLERRLTPLKGMALIETSAEAYLDEQFAQAA